MRKMIRGILSKLVICVLAVNYFSAGATADIFHCGNTFQNKPCDEGESGTLALLEKVSPTLSPAQEAEKFLKDCKQYLWVCEGRYPRYPNSDLVPLRAAIRNCEEKGKAEPECQAELRKARFELSKKVEAIDAQRARDYDQLAIEEAKLREMQKQTELQRKQLIELQNLPKY